MISLAAWMTVSTSALSKLRTTKRPRCAGGTGGALGRGLRGPHRARALRGGRERRQGLWAGWRRRHRDGWRRLRRRPGPRRGAPRGQGEQDENWADALTASYEDPAAGCWGSPV